MNDLLLLTNKKPLAEECIYSDYLIKKLSSEVTITRPLIEVSSCDERSFCNYFNSNISNYTLPNLPNNMIELYEKYFNVKCYYCHKLNKNSLICLICGIKLCSSMCISDNLKFVMHYHTLRCGYNNGIFIQLAETRIIYMMNGVFGVSDEVLYSNKFGEILLDGIISKDFILNFELYEIVKKQFLSNKFSKKIKANDMTESLNQQ